MAEITKHAKVSTDAATAMYAAQISGLVAGEALATGDAACIKADGKVWKTNATGAAGTELTIFAGIVYKAAAVGEAVTLVGIGARVFYATGRTPGTLLYLSAAVPGGLSDTATTGSPALAHIGQWVTAQDFRIVRNT